MTWALETGWPSWRSTPATSTSQRATGRSVEVNRWWYQPGERTPAPYPCQDASRAWVHGTHVIATLTFASPRTVAASAAALGSGAASAGTCQAPQTTATRA